jgi:single-strand DNA-binding protein
MANLNKVFLIGNLTRDPELRYTPSGTGLVEFGMAINRRWKAQDGSQKEETCFVDVNAWGRTAEVIQQYCRKGSQLFVEGRLQLNQWEGQDGQKRSKMRVVVENMQLLGSRPSQQGGAGSPPAPKPQRREEEGAPPPPADEQEPLPQNSDDIPF